MNKNILFPIIFMVLISLAFGGYYFDSKHKQEINFLDENFPVDIDEDISESIPTDVQTNTESGEGIDTQNQNTPLPISEQVQDGIGEQVPLPAQDSYIGEKTIKILTFSPITWQENEVSYSVSKAFLIRRFIDMGDYGENPGIKGMNFLVFELNAFDTRIEGEGRRFDYINFFRLKDDRDPTISKKPDYLSIILGLYPQESLRTFPYIIVPPEQKTFSVHIGNLGTPNIRVFDFDMATAETIEGDFYMREGLKK